MNIITKTKQVTSKLFIYSLLILFQSSSNAELEVLGWLESAYVQPWGIKLRTKLDTGARTSSIHVADIEPFQKNDELWVRFSIPYKVSKNDPEYKNIIVEKPVIRETRIKEHVGESKTRYVVEIEFCLNGKHYLTPFTLADRSNYNYPMLLGRLTLKDKLLVDPSRSFTANKSCL